MEKRETSTPETRLDELIAEAENLRDGFFRKEAPSVWDFLDKVARLKSPVPTYDDIQRALTPFVNHWHRPDAVRAVLAILPVAGVSTNQAESIAPDNPYYPDAK